MVQSKDDIGDTNSPGTLRGPGPVHVELVVGGDDAAQAVGLVAILLLGLLLRVKEGAGEATGLHTRAQVSVHVIFAITRASCETMIWLPAAAITELHCTYLQHTFHKQRQWACSHSVTLTLVCRNIFLLPAGTLPAGRHREVCQEFPDADVACS